MSKEFNSELEIKKYLTLPEDVLGSDFYHKVVNKNNLKAILAIFKNKYGDHLGINFLVYFCNKTKEFFDKYNIYLGSYNLKSSKVSIIFIKKIIIEKYVKLLKTFKNFTKKSSIKFKYILLENSQSNFNLISWNLDLLALEKFSIHFSVVNSIKSNFNIGFKRKKTLFINNLYFSMMANSNSKKAFFVTLEDIKDMLASNGFNKNGFNKKEFSKLFTKIQEFQIKNILNNFEFIKYENNIWGSYLILMKIFHFSKIYFSKIKLLIKSKSFKSKNDLKFLFIEKYKFIQKINFDKLNLLQILVIYKLLISDFNNEKNFNEINQIIEMIKISNKTWFNNLEEILLFDIKTICLKIFLKLHNQKVTKEQQEIFADIISLKSNIKNTNTLSFYYWKTMIRLSKNSLLKTHDKLVKKMIELKAKIEVIQFDTREIFVLKPSKHFQANLITNSFDLFSLGKIMKNCVYTRLKNIQDRKSLIYSIEYQGQLFCLEIGVSKNKKPWIKELRARFNKEAPQKLFNLINSNINSSYKVIN